MFRSRLSRRNDRDSRSRHGGCNVQRSLLRSVAARCRLGSGMRGLSVVRTAAHRVVVLRHQAPANKVRAPKRQAFGPARDVVRQANVPRHALKRAVHPSWCECSPCHAARSEATLRVKVAALVEKWRRP